MSDGRPSAIIIDDATLTRASLPTLMPRLRFVAGYATATELVDDALTADLVILELQRADKSAHEVREGLDSLRRAVAAGHRVCIYTQEARPFVHAACLAGGACGVVSRADPLHIAEQAFIDVALGETLISQGLVDTLAGLPRRTQLTVVNARQRVLLHARAQQRSFTSIADELAVPVCSVQEEWRGTAAAVTRFLQTSHVDAATSTLGLAPDDLADIWPCPAVRP